MKTEKFKQHRKKLEAARRETLHSIYQLKEELSVSEKDSIEELSSYDNHPADIGSETFERGKDIALKDNERLRLAKINEALSRIKNGEYGKCEFCGRKISPERLEAIPETSICEDCRKKWGKKEGVGVRPVEEEVIKLPFGGKPARGKQKTSGQGSGYDGEDAWQDVASYGTAETPSDFYQKKKYPVTFWNAGEKRGAVEEVEGLPYFRGDDGVYYHDAGGEDDEDAPGETVRDDESWEERKRVPRGKKQ